MEQFEALPLPHKVLIVFLAMACVAGLFYFLLISDLEADIALSQKKITKTEQKAAQLKRYESPELMAALDQQMAELKEQLAANKALLPEAEQIPALITSIKRQADELGLKIERFEKTERSSEDYVDTIPVKMEVEGSFPVVVAFFEALAQPGMRMMTVTDMNFKSLPIKELMERESAFPVVGGMPSSGGRAGKGSGRDGPSSPIQQFIDRLDNYERAVGNMRVAAKFTVNAYSYTGQLLSNEERTRRSRMKKRRTKR